MVPLRANFVDVVTGSLKTCHIPVPAGKFCDVVDRLAENVPYSPGQRPQAARSAASGDAVCSSRFAPASGTCRGGRAASSPALWSSRKPCLWVSLTHDRPAHLSCPLHLEERHDAPCVWRRPRAGCGCTKVQLAKYELAPGENTELKATLDVTGRYVRGAFPSSSPITPATPDRLVIEATVRTPARAGAYISAPIPER